MQSNEITYCRASKDEELHQILKLQKLNLPDSLSVSDKENEGFLTVVHTFEILKQMNDCCPHIIAKNGDEVVGYALSMHPKFADEITVIKPMFDEINKIISDNSEYIIMGQVCVDKNYRKRGIFRGLYNFMEQELQSTFKSIITEVNASNKRSLDAHLAVGFEILKEYYENEKHWVIISLNCSTN
ncbi:GNAT family N-acetyltransferase [Flavobacteriaceae bacterium LMO-SS05]